MEEIDEYQKRAMGKIKALSESRLKAALDFVNILRKKRKLSLLRKSSHEKNRIENLLYENY